MSESLSRTESDLGALVDGRTNPEPPQSRIELLLHKLLGEEVVTFTPQSRVEELLLELYEKEITGDIVAKTITDNGTYNASSEGKDGYNPVVVNVPVTIIDSLNVTENNTYTAPEGHAYSPVVVNVPQKIIDSLTATNNGTYTPEEGHAYGSVVVSIPLASERSW